MCSSDLEDGAKNPLKGISMKLLVLALNAQFRVGAGRLWAYGLPQWHAVKVPFAPGGFILWQRQLHVSDGEPALRFKDYTYYAVHRRCG